MQEVVLRKATTSVLCSGGTMQTKCDGDGKWDVVKRVCTHTHPHNGGVMYQSDGKR